MRWTIRDGLRVAVALAAGVPAALGDTDTYFLGIAGPDGTVDITANGISGDGSTVVGSYLDATGFEVGFSWTKSAGRVDLDGLSMSESSAAMAVSDDGSVVTGFSGAGIDAQAVRWVGAASPMSLMDLDPMIDGISEGRAISADGSMIVGVADGCSCGLSGQAYVWTMGAGMQGLGFLEGASVLSRANGISADGNIIVGDGDTAMGNQAFRSVGAGALQGLGDLAGGSFSSRANAVSADGSTIVGSSVSADGLEAFMWTEGDLMVGLGALEPGVFSSEAFDVSADGSVIVGSSSTSLGAAAFIYTDGQMLDLNEVLSDAGFDLSGWRLTEATGVSDDGLTIAGVGVFEGQSRGFVARIPSPGTLAIVCPAALLTWTRRRR